MLGSLEKRILSALRKVDKANARQIYETLTKEGLTAAYVTINTVLSRLTKRGLVIRTKEEFRGKYRYIYQYVEVKDQLIDDFLVDVDILFGEEGFDDLKMRLGSDEIDTIASPTPPLAPETGEGLRIRLSQKGLRSALIKKVEDISGQKIMACYQCGKCSAGCPMVSSLDLLPNQIIRLIQLGETEEVLNSKTIWLCASCYQCSDRCPMGVDLTKLMEALRLVLLRKKSDHVDISELDVDENLPQIALISNLRKMTG